MPLWNLTHEKVEEMKRLAGDKAAEFEALLKAWNVHHEVGNLPDKPTTGARIERVMQLVGNGTRVTLLRSGLHYKFWSYALVTWCRNFNLTSVNPSSGVTPYEQYRSKKPTQNVIPFGALVYFLEHNEGRIQERRKFDSKSK